MKRFSFSLVLLAGVFSFAGVASAHAQFIPGMSRNANGTGAGGEKGLGIGTYDTKTVVHERVVSGVVKGKDGVPAKGAVVYLKNDGNKNVKSVTVDETGKFRFVQLSRTVDYQLWAESKEKKTDQKTISQFDTRDTITRELTIE
ncbi:carboxypeptidase-like regulatory domain-containing protein [Terriglobus roseus]|nr:carboxypeptidase-like regulatory domain-containing protein [Terriglobus roseus]